MTQDLLDTENGGFAHVPGVKAGIIIELVEQYMRDSDPHKLSLNAGTYRDEHGQPYILEAVRKAAKRLQQRSTYNHEYLSMEGLPRFLLGAKAIALGASVDSSKVASLQTIGGTGACHLGAAFLRKWYTPGAIALVSDPSWENHLDLFEHEGIQTSTYPYWDPVIRGINFDGMMAAVETAPNRSLIVLHACGHNPTGADLTKSQWTTLSDMMVRKHHFAFFDSAYQGFVSGDLDEDGWAVRLFHSRSIQLLVAQSFSKNAGLYGERLGALHVPCASVEEAQNVTQQLKVINRREISSASRFGADIMATIFDDQGLMQVWHTDLKEMCRRVSDMRQRFVDLLATFGTPGDWSHIVQQRGMFAYTGLTEIQCQAMLRDYHIYLPPSGRISVAGLNEGNIFYVAQSFDRVVRAYP